MEYDFPKIKKALTNINWNFENAHSQYGLHRLHWYPATFIPQIPSYLIELFSKVNDIVFDPFCGVGTTVVESLRLRRMAIGIDINSLACLISKTKTTFIDPNLLRETQHDFSEILEGKLPYRKSGGKLPEKDELNKLADEYKFIAPWYHEETFFKLIYLWCLISKVKGTIRNLLTISFSQILKKSSSQTEHWGYVADNMVPSIKYNRDAFKLFMEAFNDSCDGLIDFLNFPNVRHIGIRELNKRSLIIMSDITQGALLKEGTVDLIVTSPPYVNVTDYTTSQRLSFYWLKKDINALKQKEIGARWKRFRKNSIGQYLSEMEHCLGNIAKVLKAGKFLCLILGESINREPQHNIFNKLIRIIENNKFETFSNQITRIPSHQRLKNRLGSTNPEHILIFRKK